MGKKRKVEASAEEQEMMRRAEARVAAISDKPSTSGYTFDEKKEAERAIEARQQPGITVVEGAPSGMPGNERQEAVSQQKTTTFSPEQVKSYGTGDALLNTLNSAPKSGEIILNSVYNDSNSTITDIQNAKDLGKVANQEEEKEKANIENEIYSGPGASNLNLAPNATSSTLTNIGEQQGKPSFASTGTKEDVSKGMDEQYKREAESIPAGVIEKLGVQDYYPQIGRDVAVGTFTGSRIGSQTIYSGAGVLLPQGLYDARKRALASAAQEKQKKIEEYLKIGDTLPQFNSEYKNYAYNTLVKYAEKHNYNPDSLFKDREFMNEKYRLETLGKEIEYVGGIADGVFEKYQSKDGKPGSFVPDDVMKAAIDFRSGVADMDAILSGKSSVLDVAKRLKTYTNGTTWADGRLSEWKSKPTELPINLKNQEKMTIKDLNKIQDEIKKVRISGDHDSYVTAVSKHYKLEPEVIDSWIAMNMPGASDKDKEFVSENLNKYILSQMPDDSIEAKIESLSNQNFERWKTKEGWKREDEKAKTFFTRLQDEADKQNIPGKVSGIYVNSSAWNTMISEDSKQNRLASIYEGLGVVTKNSKNKKDAYALINVDSKSAFAAPVNISTSNQNATIQLKRADGKKEWVNLNTAAKYLQKDGNTAWIGGVKYTIPKDSDDYTAIKNFKNNDVIQVIDNAKEIRAGHYGNDGNLYNLSTDNMNNYLSSNKKTIVVTVEGNVGVWRDVKVGVDEKGKPIYEKQIQKSSANVRYAGDNNDKQFRDIIDVTQGQAQQRMAGGEFNYAPVKP